MQSSLLGPAAAHTCDALIVGGGPAGLAAAISLRGHGIDVIVADAATPPIDKACGEGLMPDSRRELLRLGVDQLPGKEFHGICFSAPEGESVSANFPQGKGLGVRRQDLHHALVHRAHSVGVRLHWGARVDLTASGSVRIAGERCTYKYLVGADGEASQVRRWAALEAGHLKSRRFGFRRHYQSKPWSDHVEVHWGSAGQAYVTPVSGNEVCIAAVTRHHQLHFDAILATIPSLRGRLDTASITGRNRGALTTTRILRRVTRENIALVGDASGTVDAITGEGLASSFRQALLLGAALARDCIADYERGHASILRLPRQMSALMLLMDRLPLVRRRALRALRGSPELFSRMLGVHVGEERITHFALTQGLAVAYRAAFPRPLPLAAPEGFEPADVVFN